MEKDGAINRALVLFKQSQTSGDWKMRRQAQAEWRFATRGFNEDNLLAAAQAVANQVDPTSPGSSLLPPVENLRASSATVAVAVARQAEADGVATASHDNLIQAVQDAMWQPVYPEVEV